MSKTKISPTVGRVVWLRNRHEAISREQPEVAFITYVHSDSCINVAGFNANGTPIAETSVLLVQDGEPAPEHVYAEWMPYQKGQAAKTQEVSDQMAALQAGQGPQGA